MSPVINTHNVSVTKNNNSSSSNMMEERYYESIIFSGPIVFTLIILFLFYFFYLRRHSVDWSSLRMRQSRIDSASASAAAADDLVNEVGLKKEFRELLPVIIYKESFTVKDTQCSVCLGDYQAEDKLQQIPGCYHTFHLNCIDLWLATHTTCPLCRLSLVTSSKDPPDSHPDSPSDNDSRGDSVYSIDGVLNSDNPSDNGSGVESVHSVDDVHNPDNPPSGDGSRVDSVHSIDCVHLQSRLQVS
ncbi:uncharacterized protein LOC141605351 [Silene latifolia]|uniref:uncharacterized protein LOC141605351 n=1 Tax=Silene latifolia TaxID=37657 RepID=UPI003D76BD92